MSDVFISYKQEERDRMLPIAEALRALGVDVWFDARLEPGQSFTEEIQREVYACAAQLVCWSPTASASEWVRGEADIGRQRGVLVPVLIAACSLPPPFNMLHAESLANFSGQAAHGGWTKVLATLGAKLGRPGLAALWPLLSEGDAAGWKAWAEANPTDPFHDEAWARYEALHLDAERNRVASERADARRRAEADETKRKEQEARAEAERMRLAAMRDQAEREAEAGRRAAQETAAETPRPKTMLRTSLFFTATLGAAALATLIAVLIGLLPEPSSAQSEAVAQSSAPVQSISPTYLQALQLRGAWAPSADQCRMPFRLDVVSDAAGERLVWNGDSGAAEPILRLEEGWLVTRSPVQIALLEEARRRGYVVSDDGPGAPAYRIEGGRLQVREPGREGSSEMVACPEPSGS